MNDADNFYPCGICGGPAELVTALRELNGVYFTYSCYHCDSCGYEYTTQFFDTLNMQEFKLAWMKKTKRQEFDSRI